MLAHFAFKDDRHHLYKGPLPEPPPFGSGKRTFERRPEDKGFRSTGTAAWPPGLCSFIERGMVAAWRSRSLQHT